MTYGDYPDLSKVRRILVVKLRHLGDVLLTLPLFSELKAALPNAQIDAYVYQDAVSLLEGHPAVCNIIAYDREWKRLFWWKRFFREAAVWRRIRQGRYDLVINLTEGDRGALAAHISHAAIRVGVDRRSVYTHAVKNCSSPRHTVERHLDALRRIGIFPSKNPRIDWAVPSRAREAMREMVPFDDFILIHPTSRWRFKCWPVENVAALVHRLVGDGQRIVLTSGPDPDERAMVGEIVRRLPLASIVNLAGRISLPELGALIERCRCLLCVDSLPLHLASALQAPVVALFGPTSEITWGPWQNPFARVIANPISCRPCYLDGCGGGKKSECLAAIPVEKVIEEIYSLKSSPK